MRNTPAGVALAHEALAPIWPPLTIGMCAGVALMWFVPDKRMESRLS